MECMRQVGVVAELYGTVGSVLTGTASQFIGTQTIRYTALHQLFCRRWADHCHTTSAVHWRHRLLDVLKPPEVERRQNTVHLVGPSTAVEQSRRCLSACWRCWHQSARPRSWPGSDAGLAADDETARYCHCDVILVMTSFTRLAPTALATPEPAIVIVTSFSLWRHSLLSWPRLSVTDERTQTPYRV